VLSIDEATKPMAADKVKFNLTTGSPLGAARAGHCTGGCGCLGSEWAAFGAAGAKAKIF
jgi:hypothetical protein